VSYIGIDIGTTTISFVKISNTSKLLKELTVRNDANIKATVPHSLQSPERIAEIVRENLDKFIAESEGKDSPDSIGICCQMHGILYTNKGKAVSPLYTWQDACGNEIYRGGMTYAEYISFRTGYKVFSGYGLCTHFYLADKGMLPSEYDKICTVGDYVAMQLANTADCPIHPTNAASLGLYDIARDAFDTDSLEMLDIDASILPDVSADVSVIGRTKNGACVCCAVGDSQAALYGSGATENEMILNVGTGGQISCIMKNAVDVDENTEIRPYFDNQYIYTASSLCCGAAYASLNEFFRKVLSSFGIEKTAEEVYNVMDTFEKKGEPRPVTSTCFVGTRKEPFKRGSVNNLYAETFTPDRLTYSVLEGIAEELYPYYEQFLKVGGFDGIVLTGNLARKCPAFVDVVKDRYSLPVRLTLVDSEGAAGAAKTAMVAYARKGKMKRAE
jgi:sedoheptulokinase